MKRILFFLLILSGCTGSEGTHSEGCDTPITATNAGFIHGLVIAAEDDAPISGAIARLEGISGCVTTGDDGTFTVPFPDGGRYNIKVEATGRTYARRVGEVLVGHDVSVGTLVLKRLDNAVTRIGPDGGEHRSEKGGLKLKFPPGALKREVDVRATRFERGRELPAPLPKTSHFTMAAVATAEDSDLSKPVTMTFPNDLGFAPGTLVPVGHFNEDTGTWEPDGMATVSADGKEVVYEARHLSSFDCNFPPWVSDQPGLSPTDPRRKRDPCGKGATSGNSLVDIRTGHMRLDVDIPVGRLGDEEQSFGLVYQSSSARPSAWIGGRRDEKPSDLSATPEYAGIEAEAEGVRHKVYVRAADDDNWAAWIWDGRNARGELVSTGLYDAWLRVFWGVPAEYGTADVFGGPATGRTGIKASEPVEADMTFFARLPIVNGLQSPVAPGWHLKGIPRLYEHTDGTVLLVQDGESQGVFEVSGRLTLFASEPGGAFSCADGEGSKTQCLYYPEDIAIAPDGSVVIADSGNKAVRRVTSAGTWQTLYDGSSESFRPQAVAVSPDGTVYVGDGSSGVVWKIVGGVLNKVVGGDFPSIPGFSTKPTVSNPTGLAFAPDGTLYIADGGFGLRRLGPSNQLEDVVPPDAADIPGAYRVAIAPDGSVVFSETNRHQVRRLGPDGRITRIAGRDRVPGIAGDGGLATDALLNNPGALAVAQDGTIYVAEGASNRVRAISPGGRIRTFAGIMSSAGIVIGIGGSALNATIREPIGLAVEQNGNLLVLSRIDSTALRVDLSQKTYGRPRSSYDRLTRTANGWERIDRNGRIESYDSLGRMISRIENGRTTTIEYDSQGRPLSIDGGRLSLRWEADHLASITDEQGRKTSIETDGSGDIIAITLPDSSRIEFTYEGHLMRSWRDAEGRVTDYTFDRHGRISKVESAGGIRTYAPVESQGLINDVAGNSPSDPGPAIVAPKASFQDANGKAITIDYDALGEPREATLGDGSKMQWINDGCGMPGLTTSPSGKQTRMDYDDLGRVIRERGPLGERGVEWDPDNKDRFLSIWSWEGRSVRYGWNDAGDLEAIFGQGMERKFTLSWTESHQLERIEDATGAFTKYEYDDMGNLASISTNDGLVAEFENDARGNILSVTDANGTTTTFEYDPMNRPVAVHDGSGIRHELLRDRTGLLTGLKSGDVTTTFGRDSRGRLSSVSLAGALPWTITWDGEDRITAINSPLGSVLFAYDGRGRVITRTVSSGPTSDTATFTWDAEDRLLAVEDSDSRVEWSYDENTGLLQSVTQFHKGMKAPVTIEYDLDRDGWVQAVTWPSIEGFAGGRYEYDHDAFTGQVEWIRDPDGRWYELELDDAGRLTTFSIDYRESWETQYDWTPSGRLRAITVWADYYRSGRLASFEYELAPDGRRVSEATMSGKATYSYDKVNRLTGATYNDGRPAETYSYDAHGDPTGPSFELDDKRRLIKGGGFTYTFDDAGRAIRRIRDADGSRLELTWDGDDRLIEARTYKAGQTQPEHVVRYRHDGLGRRIAREVDGVTTYLIYDREDVALEVDENGRALAFYVHGPGIDQPLAMIRDGETYAYIQDGSGTVRALARLSDRKVVRTYTYSVFGRLLSESGTLSNPYGFHSRERDPITGLIHFRQREYDPEVGRFLTTDPLRFTSLSNTYAFPSMDPVNRQDPFGAGPRIVRGAGRAAEWYSNFKTAIDDNIVQPAGNLGGSEVAEAGSLIFKTAAVPAFEGSRYFPLGKFTPYASPGPTVLDAATWAYKAYKAKDPCERAKVAGDFLVDLLPAGKRWFKPLVDNFNNFGNLVEVGR